MKLSVDLLTIHLKVSLFTEIKLSELKTLDFDLSIP